MGAARGAREPLASRPCSTGRSRHGGRPRPSLRSRPPGRSGRPRPVPGAGRPGRRPRPGARGRDRSPGRSAGARRPPGHGGRHRRRHGRPGAGPAPQAAGVSPDRLAFVEADLLGLQLPDAGRYAFAFIALNSIMLLASRDAQRGAFRDPRRAPGPGRARRRRRLAARRRRSRPLRRPDHARVAADGSRYGRRRDEGRLGPARCRHEHGQPQRDLRGGPPGRGAPPLGPARPAPARLGGRARGLRRGCRACAWRSWPADYDLSPIGPGSERAVLVAERAGRPEAAS